MELVQNPTPNVTYTGRGDVLVPDGKKFKIETTPGGSESINVGPPAGKKWLIGVTLNVIETDA